MTRFELYDKLNYDIEYYYATESEWYKIIDKNINRGFI